MSLISFFLTFWMWGYIASIIALVSTELYYMSRSQDYILWIIDTSEQYQLNEKMSFLSWGKEIFFSFIFWPELFYIMYKAFSSGRTVNFYLMEKVQNKRKENQEIEKRLLEEKSDEV